MRRTLLVLGVLALALTPLLSEQTVSLVDGRQLLLRDDGAYEWVESEEHVKLVITGVSPYESEGTTVAYRLENHGYGTLRNYSITVQASDDRGNEIGEYDIDTWDEIQLAVGHYLTDDFVIYDSVPKYLRRLVVIAVTEGYFNMRMLPESVDVSKMLRVHSEVDGLEFTLR